MEASQQTTITFPRLDRLRDFVIAFSALIRKRMANQKSLAQDRSY